MSIYTMNIFLTAAERGSFIKTATELNLTPSAVSHAIGSLEEEFGFPLFIRKRSGLVLTENAKTIMPFVRDCVSGHDRLMQVVNRIKKLDTGIVRIGAFHSVSVEWMPAILKSFSEKSPDIEVRIYRGTYQELVDMVDDNALDIAFTVQTVSGGYDFLPLWSEPLVCVTPKDFVPRNKTYVTPDELSENRLFIEEHGGGYEAESYIREHNVKVYGYLKVDDDNMMMALADKGVGISIVPEITVHNKNLSAGTGA